MLKLGPKERIKKNWVIFLIVSFFLVIVFVFAIIPQIGSLIELRKNPLNEIKNDMGNRSVLKGSLKYLDGINNFPIKNQYISLDSGFGESIDFETDTKGNFYKEGIKPGSYNLRILINGYTLKIIPNIFLYKGETISLDRTIDLSDNTGVEGEITLNTKLPNNGFSVNIMKKSEERSGNNDFCMFRSRSDSSYYCYNLNPGKYSLEIVAVNQLDLYKKKIEITLEQFKTKHLDINLTDKDKEN